MSGTASIDLSFTCDIEYVCTSKGYPEQGPTYSCGGQPAEPPEFNIKVFWRRNSKDPKSLDITHMLTDSQMDEVHQVVSDDYAFQ